MDNTELGHFSLLEKIGEGGMGRVFKARDTRLGRLVAIKLLAEARLEDSGRRARFVQEAKAASALNHPNIITIHEVGEHDGRTFIVMELVEGLPLNELIPAKGMRLTDALRIAVQVAGALTTAHAAGIVHRDLKPGNIMVDAHGRVKVLDFGLAKLSAPAALFAVEADEGTRTLVLDQPVTEEGMIVGSVPYMSPEQAEGKPVDARSDIFSFGAVLYEMITGQRAFRGESRVSTLAALMEKDPQPPSEISSTTPPELERLIVRCLRKDVHRRSQSMADVKLALEELREESESGKLARPAAAPRLRVRHWLWPTVAIASVLIAAAAFIWIYFGLRGAQSKAPELVRVSPDDGHSYGSPAISPDGGFVAYVSDRSGKNQLWLQQVGRRDAIQLTHSSESVSCPSFFPDGMRILYVTTSADQEKSRIEVISTLGGEPTVLVQGNEIENSDPMLSPDGRQLAYFERSRPGWRLMTASSDGARRQELSNSARIHGMWFGRAAWTPDSRYLLCLVTKTSQAMDSKEFEWFAIPVAGSAPVPTGAGAALRAAGLGLAAPVLMVGDRVLFYSGPEERINTWEIRLSPGSWRVKGDLRQLTFGTVSESPNSISSKGIVALNIGKASSDIHLIPLSSATGQPTSVTQRLTRDGRYKGLGFLGGNPGNVYFSEFKVSRSLDVDYYALDLKSGKQSALVTGISGLIRVVVSSEGRHVAYSIPDANSFSIRVGEAGSGFADARVICKTCGKALRFSADGQFLFYQPHATAPNQKLVVRLLEVASGKDLAWLEHPSDSVGPEIDTFGEDLAWVAFAVSPPGSQGPSIYYVAHWRAGPIPPSEWIKVRPLPSHHVILHRGYFFYFLQDSKLAAILFNPKTRTFGEPHDINFVPGSQLTPEPEDQCEVRGPGLVFAHGEYTGSVWLMKLPR